MSALKQIYSGEALETYNKIRGHEPITINKVYQSNNTLFYLNTRGYLHIYRPTKIKFNDITYYGLNDYMLTKDNMLSDKGTYYQTDTIDDLKKTIEELLA